MRSPTSTRTSRGRRLLAAALGTITALALAVPSWGLPADEVEASTSAGADWVAEQVAADGSVSNGFSGPVGNAVQAALGLVGAGEGGPEFEAIVDYVRDNVGEEGDYTGPCPATAETDPGALGYVLLLVDAADENPNAFGDDNLVQCLKDTRQPNGLYGDPVAKPPTFDGTFRQSLALLGLAGARVTPDPSAVQWLRDQQCESGGWPSYRPDTTVPCGTEGTFDSTAPNTNSTGLAVQAFAALGETPAHDPVPYLEAAQNDDGGFGYDSVSATDSNSTALVIQGLLALGEQPDAGAWVHVDQDSAFTALRQLQLGCEAAETDRGAFAYQPDEDGGLSPNGGATYAALMGMGSLVLPPETRTATGATSEPSCPELAIERDGGDDRIATSVELALDTYPDGAGTVVIARAFGYADALAGGPLAANLDAPILLSYTDQLPEEVILAIDQLDATDAVLLGETEALSDAVRETLEDDLGLNVTRVGGDTRFHTAADIARILGGDEVYVTEGVDPDPSRGWPDAVSVSPLASFQQRPILLVSTDTLPDATAAVLDGRSATIIGGEVAVSEEVEDAIADATGSAVSRIAGDDRYRTSLAVSRVARDAGMDPATSWVATGEKFPDALAAGPAIAARGGVLILVASSGVPSATADYVHEVNLVLEGFHLVGGEVVIPPSVVDGLVAEARAS